MLGNGFASAVLQLLGIASGYQARKPRKKAKVKQTPEDAKAALEAAELKREEKRKRRFERHGNQGAKSNVD